MGYKQFIKYNTKCILGKKKFNTLIRIKKFDKQTKKILSNNIEYKNIHSGKRCFIIGNGPSINNQDFSLLKNEITFTVNQLPRNKIFKDIRTNYHLWVDERFFDLKENRPEDMELLDIMNKVNLYSNPVVFYKLAAKAIVDRYDLSKNLNVSYFQDGLSIYDNFNEKFDFTKLVPHFPTVVHYAIALAIYMGIKEIYLLGCDCTGFITIAQSQLCTNNYDFQYGYSISENEKRRMLRTNSIHSIEEELVAHAEIFKIYKILYKYCNKNKIKLVNCTDGGLLNGIERNSLSNIL